MGSKLSPREGREGGEPEEEIHMNFSGAGRWGGRGGYEL